VFNALFNYEMKTLGLYTYLIIQRVGDTFCFSVRFVALECMHWCLMLSVDLGVHQAVVRPRPNETKDDW